ncbi:MAG: alpha/beta fold hydrolase [Candidatus Saccharimonadales bacterium]
MPKKQPLNPADYMEPLYMNGLHGRMLRLKPGPRKSKEILVIYGQHASLERTFSIAQSLNKYGGVTIPDLPGFGGMQSFYRLNEKPTVDNLADYLASFVKLRYKHRRLTIIGVSFGFAVVTRMLQRYPEIAKKVDLLVSVVGFVHHDDFVFKRHNYAVLRYGSRLFSHRLSAWLAKYIFLRPSFIKATYRLAGPKNPKLRTQDIQERDNRIAYEIHLWKINDLRTYMFATNQMLKLDLCHQQIDLPVHHVGVPQDRYFNNEIIEQHLGVIYQEVSTYVSKLPAHMPTLATDEDAAKLIPPAIKRLLAKA